jgi:hypothetical protein
LASDWQHDRALRLPNRVRHWRRRSGSAASELIVMPCHAILRRHFRRHLPNRSPPICAFGSARAATARSAMRFAQIFFTAVERHPGCDGSPRQQSSPRCRDNSQSGIEPLQRVREMPISQWFSNSAMKRGVAPARFLAHLVEPAFRSKDIVADCAHGAVMYTFP